MKSGVDPASTHSLGTLRGFGSTGSALTADGFEWVYSHVKDDVWLASISGGTDLCTAFVGGCPMLPVRAGEIQCRNLGADIAAYDELGVPVVGEMGELVIRQPMPSMPVYLWGDATGREVQGELLQHLPGRLAARGLDQDQRGRQLRDLRQVGRHDKEDGRPDGDERGLPRGGVDPRGLRQPRRRHGVPRRRPTCRSSWS